jgi:hypothetical protein
MMVLSSDEPLAGPITDCDLMTVVNESSEKDCARYHGLFVARARVAQDAGDITCAALFTLLAATCSFSLKTESPEDPFTPLFTIDGKRTPLPEDLSDVELSALSSILAAIVDWELRARISDVLWVRRRDHNAARLAIESYIRVAGALLETEDNWPKKAERCARALQLAAALGRKTPEFSSVVERIESYILARAKESSFAVKRLMDILLEHRQGNAERMSEVASAQASLATDEQAWPMAAEYHEVRARWEDRLGHTEEKKASLVAAAESYVRWGAECLQRERPSHIEAAEHLQHAIATLRSAGGQADRVDQLRRQLITIQERVMGELGVIEHETDLTDYAERARREVKRSRWQDALFKLAHVARPLSAEQLRKRVNDAAAHSAIIYLMPRTKIDVDGRPILRVPPLLNSNAEEREFAMFAAMCDQAALERDLLVAGVIRPARLQVLADHAIGEREFLTLVTANPFVTQGHELLFARGLRAGFVGDFIVASHLLMPSLEASIRRFMRAKGVITSTLRDGVQQVFSLNMLLNAPQANEMMGDDLVFNLRSLLSEPAGDNLRNRALHGLAHQFEYDGRPAYEFAWWLTLFVCMRFRVLADNATQETEPQRTDGTEGEEQSEE